MFMKNNKFKVACRASRLSLLQAWEFARVCGVDCELLAEEAFGDRNKHISLMDGVPSDFFTREQDDAVRGGRADIAVHSAKDLPYPMVDGLKVLALLEPADKSDSLLSCEGWGLETLPSGARVGTSSAERREKLLKARPDVEIVSIRGTIEERIELVEQGEIDALIVATCALERLGIRDRPYIGLPFPTHPLQGSLAVVGRSKDRAAEVYFKPYDIRTRYGRVTLVGFGPGDPDLLTVAGMKSLKEADVIFYDALTDVSYLDNFSAEKLYVGKRKGDHSHSQDEINELLYRAAVEGKNTVRLKGGDPMVFAHGREEIDYLQSRLVEVRVIPGISAGIALSSYTHIPLTHRGVASSVAFISGHSHTQQEVKADTLVYYMAAGQLSAVAKSLLEHGRSGDTPAALVYNISLPSQKVFYSSLRELEFSAVKYPTPLTVIVGDVVSFESHRAPSQQVLYTGTDSRDYKGEGRVVHKPLIDIRRREVPSIEKSLAPKRGYDWIVFTSRYGVRYFFETLSVFGIDIRTILRAKIVSVGVTTSAELRGYNLYPDFESPTNSAAGIIDFFRGNGITGQSILLPRSDKGLTTLSDSLRSLGNAVEDVAVYENRPSPVRNLPCEESDKIVFTSPSTVDAYIAACGELPSGTLLVARGLTTENHIKKHIKLTGNG